MSLSADDVRRIAHLARLAVSDDEIAAVQGQLNGILGMVETLRAVDTQGVAPMAHAVEMTQRLRADAVTESDRRAAYQEGAPAVENGLFLVPRVIE